MVISVRIRWDALQLKAFSRCKESRVCICFISKHGWPNSVKVRFSLEYRRSVLQVQVEIAKIIRNEIKKDVLSEMHVSSKVYLSLL